MAIRHVIDPRRRPVPATNLRNVLAAGAFVALAAAIAAFVYGQAGVSDGPGASDSVLSDPGAASPSVGPQPDRAGDARLAIVIGEWGSPWPAAGEFLSFHRPLTFAVIPGLSHSSTHASLARSRGMDVLVHLPMEAATPESTDIPGAVTSAMSPKGIRTAVRTALAAVPGAIGVSNHQGSSATADPDVVGPVLDAVGAADGFFLDSRTTGGSVVPAVGEERGVRVLVNDLFLDTVPSVDAVKAQLRGAVEIAKRDGDAIAIGRVRSVTAQAIREMLAEIEEAGVQLVPLSALLEATPAGEAPPADSGG